MPKTATAVTAPGLADTAIPVIQSAFQITTPRQVSPAVVPVNRRRRRRGHYLSF
jgi:hypothetical protein